jgi:hypothetical protein
LPEQPGLGVELNPDALTRFAAAPAGERRSPRVTVTIPAQVAAMGKRVVAAES